MQQNLTKDPKSHDCMYSVLGHFVLQCVFWQSEILLNITQEIFLLFGISIPASGFRNNSKRLISMQRVELKSALLVIEGRVSALSNFCAKVKVPRSIRQVERCELVGGSDNATGSEDKCLETRRQTRNVHLTSLGCQKIASTD